MREGCSIYQTDQNTEGLQLEKSSDVRNYPPPIPSPGPRPPLHLHHHLSHSAPPFSSQNNIIKTKYKSIYFLYLQKSLNRKIFLFLSGCIKHVLRKYFTRHIFSIFHQTYLQYISLDISLVYFKRNLKNNYFILFFSQRLNFYPIITNTNMIFPNIFYSI